MTKCLHIKFIEYVATFEVEFGRFWEGLEVPIISVLSTMNTVQYLKFLSFDLFSWVKQCAEVLLKCRVIDANLFGSIGI